MNQPPIERLTPADIKDETPQSLTPRESELLALLAEGRSNAEIAYKLHISLQTVKNHLHSAYVKLNVGSRTEAVLWYLKNTIKSE